MKNPLRTVSILALSASLSGAAVIHFNPSYTGAVQNGSMENPWTTLDKCFTLANPGDVCLLEPGDYNLAIPGGGSMGLVKKSGTATAPIRVEARLEGSVLIGAWHDVNWTNIGTNLWKGTPKTPFVASIQSLQAQTASFLTQSGVRLLYRSRHAFVRHATWPRSSDVFPRTRETNSGSTYSVYRTPSLPPGALVGAKVHVFRNEEQGAVLRTVASKFTESSLGIADGDPDNDEMASRGGTRRFWITDHPDLLDPAIDDGIWTYDPSNESVRMASSIDPNLLGLSLQVSSVGPMFFGQSYWTFRGVKFFGVVPTTDNATTGLRFENVSFQGVGLSQGMKTFGSTQLDISGLVLRGSGHVVDRSSFSLCPNSCIEVVGSDVTIKNSIFTFTQLNGGAYTGSVHVQGPNALVRDNKFDELGVSGVVLSKGGSGARVSNNLIERWGRLAYTRGGGIVAIGKGYGSCEIDSNMIFRQSILDAPRSNPLPGGGIHLLFSRDNAFIHHNIIDSAMVGIRLGGTMAAPDPNQDNSFNNLIYSNDVGAGVRYSWLRVAMATASNYSGTRIFNNIFRTDAGYQSMQIDQYAGVVPTAAGAGIAGGSIGNLLLKDRDPNFADPRPPSWDYSLAPGSTAIDGGIAYVLPSGSTVRFKGFAPDIGAVEFGTSWQAGVKPPEPSPSSSALSMDAPSLWSIPVDQPVEASTVNKVEGLASFSVVPTGYKLLTSPLLDQSVVIGTKFVSFGVYVPTLQSNPWWVGTVQVYIECPSRGLWSQWVGQVELTNLPKDNWQVARLPLPEYVANQLAGAYYSDLKVMLTVNLNPGSGNLGLDDFRFEN